MLAYYWPIGLLVLSNVFYHITAKSLPADVDAARPKKLKFSYKEQREFETIDADIADMEERLTAVDAQIGQAGSDYGRLQELSAEREQLTAALDEKMERWVYLNDLAEKIEAQT